MRLRSLTAKLALPLSMSLALVLFPVAQISAQLEDPDAEVVSSLRLRNSDPTSLWRFIKFTGGAVGIAFALYVGHRLVQRHWPRPKARKLSGWHRTLQGYGLDAAERDFVARLGRPQDIDPVRLIVERGTFEHAVEHDSELVRGDSRSEKMLASVRRKLGWDRTAEYTPMPAGSNSFDPSVASLELNQEVELFGVGGAAGFCARAILVHRDDQNLVFRFLEGKEEIPFGPNDRLQVYFWRPNDAGYLCQTKVKEMRAKGPGFLITALPNAVERQQKRIYVRVPYRESFRFLHIPLSSASELLGSETRSGGVFDGACEDLSAGGFRLRTEVELHPGDYVSIPHFGAVNDEEVMARVVGELQVAEDGVRRFGVQYTGIPAKLRDVIGHLVFRIQRQAIGDRRREAELAASAMVPSDAVDSGETTE